MQIVSLDNFLKFVSKSVRKFNGSFQTCTLPLAFALCQAYSLQPFKFKVLIKVEDLKLRMGCTQCHHWIIKIFSGSGRKLKILGWAT